MISQPNVSAGTAPARFEELAAEEASRTFAGREKELAQLSEMLGPAGPAIVYLHGIPGIGKSRLISAFADHARHENATIIVMDCRSVEPTEQGFLHALGLRFGKNLNSLDETMAVLGGAGRRVVLALDHFEVLRLLDSWLRRTFIPQLPATVRLVLADREAPSPAWAAQPGWQRLFRSVELDGLSSGDATLLLARLGIPESRVTRINRLAQGHPLALTLAASSLANRQDPELEDLAIHRVISELTQLYLAEIADPVTRRMLETASVLRRVTVSLLRAIIPDIPPQDAFARLKTLPFVHIALDGLHIHDAVKQVVATALRAADPAMYREYRRAAWLQLRAELATAAPVDHWRYTADMLYLLENPGIRDAFFSSGAPAFGVEPARAADGPAIRDITDRHEGKQALHAVCEWWTAAPETFFVIRDREGKTVGFYCLCDSARVPERLLREDTVVKQWAKHLEKDPLAENETALFLRRWLSVEEGEAPSAIQAAAWLDIKRTYLALRPRLRRVYLVLQDIAPYGTVAQTLGFAPQPDLEVKLDSDAYHTAMLDFGPASVDGWLGRLVAAELGVPSSEMLDVEARELVLDDTRVRLTKLEFAVLHYLREREGKAVGREVLIRDVWGYKYDVGSNVVDAVIKSLRKKLGAKSDLIETVPGHGYKFRTAA
jgi:hypothetical protein